MGAAELAKAVNLSGPRAVALRRFLKIDDDPSCRHMFEFGKAKHDRFSDNARNRMKVALDAGVDMEQVWREHRPGIRRRQEPGANPAPKPRAA